MATDKLFKLLANLLERISVNKLTLIKEYIRIISGFNHVQRQKAFKKYYFLKIIIEDLTKHM